MKKRKWIEGLITSYWDTLVSAFLLGGGLLLDYFDVFWFHSEIKWSWYLIAYFLIGKNVLTNAFNLLVKGGVFNEFFLMSLATLGAIYLGELAEAVSVMLFYTVGEQMQHSAVKRARTNIKAMLEKVPDTLIRVGSGGLEQLPLRSVKIGDTVLYRAGDKVALDGEVESDEAAFDTSSSTGESMPKTFSTGDEVLAGYIVLGKSVKVKVTRELRQSATARIVRMVERAAEKKSKSQRFISAFARVYTPIVVFGALGVVFLPYLFLPSYDFELWLYRALIFLVISCPCALVISIPLGYFGGLGAAARKGIFFKGANYLDRLAKIDTLFFDKTGTLTENEFEVSDMNLTPGHLENLNVEAVVYAMTSRSSHPVSRALSKKIGVPNQFLELEVNEISGLGLKAEVDGKTVLLGSPSFMKREGVGLPVDDKKQDAWVVLAVNGQMAGHFVLEEKVKDGAAMAMAHLRRLGIQSFGILSGDRHSKVEKLKNQFDMRWAYGELLPEDKLQILTQHKSISKNLAYVGDGINDGPVLAMADVGIAMGQSGSDVAVEAADVVIQDDKLEKIPQGVEIGKKTRVIVWQNIVMAIGIKVLVLALGAAGMASLWEAIFADVGVALLAILNAIRIK